MKLIGEETVNLAGVGRGRFCPSYSLHQAQWPIQGKCKQTNKQTKPIWKSEWIRKEKEGSDKKTRSRSKEGRRFTESQRVYRRHMKRKESEFLLSSSNSRELRIYVHAFFFFARFAKVQFICFLSTQEKLFWISKRVGINIFKNRSRYFKVNSEDQSLFKGYKFQLLRWVSSRDLL